MKSKMIFLVSVLVFFLAAPLIAQIQIVVTISGGAWNIIRNASNLTGGAGTDFATPVDSAANLVDIAIIDPQNWWQVDIRRTDTVWDPNLRIYAQRTSNGSGPGGSSISGGTTYQEITTTNTSFFTGKKDRTGVKVQLRIGGLSVTLGQKNFRTTIVYTLMDT